MTILGVILIALFMPLHLDLDENLRRTDRCSDSDVQYTVRLGDNLYSIASQFGDNRFWESIYIANADQVNNPHLIFPGQKIRIPQNVANYKEANLNIAEVLENPFCKVSEVPIAKVNESHLRRYRVSTLMDLAALESIAETESSSADSSEVVNEEEMAAFREAFNALMEEKKSEEQKKSKNTEQAMFRELDGMVHDETRSKFGRDFYDIFYRHWQSPPEASNYSIRIMEQPAPSLGSIIIVKVNDEETFKVRLQPKYDFVEEASKYAVRTTYAYLRDNKNEVIIY